MKNINRHIIKKNKVGLLFSLLLTAQVHGTAVEYSSPLRSPSQVYVPLGEIPASFGKNILANNTPEGEKKASYCIAAIFTISQLPTLRWDQLTGAQKEKMYSALVREKMEKNQWTFFSALFYCVWSGTTLYGGFYYLLKQTGLMLIVEELHTLMSNNPGVDLKALLTQNPQLANKFWPIFASNFKDKILSNEKDQQKQIDAMKTFTIDLGSVLGTVVAQRIVFWIFAATPFYSPLAYWNFYNLAKNNILPIVLFLVLFGFLTRSSLGSNITTIITIQEAIYLLVINLRHYLKYRNELRRILGHLEPFKFSEYRYQNNELFVQKEERPNIQHAIFLTLFVA